jgi:hypothetical protein
LAGRIQPDRPFLFTEDQKIKFLIDEAIFSDSFAARTRAVNEISAYPERAFDVINGILESIPAGDSVFRTFCLNAVTKLRAAELRRFETGQGVGDKPGK